jgi:hypothetical protein
VVGPPPPKRTAQGARHVASSICGVPENNPAGRLLALIKAGGRINTPGMTVEDAWAKILDVGGQRDELFRRLALVVSMPEAIREAVEGLGDLPYDRSLVLRELDHIDKALDTGLARPWAELMNRIPPTTRHSLEIISSTLSNVRPEPSIDDDKLEDVQAKVHQLFEEVIHAEIEPELRQFLLRHVQAMRLAIEDVRIRGAQAVQEVVEQVVGGVVLHPYTWEDAAGHEQGKGFLRRLLAVGNALLLAVNLTTASLRLGEDVIKALPLPKAAEPGESSDSDGDVTP